MNDNIAHFGIVHGALGIGAPHFLCLRIIGENPDQIQRAEVRELKGLGVAHATAHDKVKFLHIGLMPLGRKRETNPIMLHLRNKDMPSGNLT